MKGLTAFVLTLATLPAVSAQTPPPQFRSGVILVQLEVSVVDRLGQPISGLQQSDFTVMESGRPQKIVSVTEHGLPAGQTANAASRGLEAQRNTEHTQYYELVYESSVAQTEQPRKIAVQVASPDATARFRSLNTAWIP